MSLREVGKRLGVDPTSVADLEKGVTRPNGANAKRVAEWLDEPAPEKSRRALADETVTRMKERRQILGWS